MRHSRATDRILATRLINIVQAMAGRPPPITGPRRHIDENGAEEGERDSDASK